MDIASSTALVTGASGGIGRAVAIALAEAGARVIGIGRNLPALRSLEEAGVIVRQVDLEASDELQRFVQQSLPDLPSIDILVNCAGAGRFAPLTDHHPQEIDRLLALNVRAPIALTQAVLPAMRQRRRGRVVNVASIAGRLGVPNETVYSATKGALAVFSRALHAELAGTGVGVTVVISRSRADVLFRTTRRTLRTALAAAVAAGARGAGHRARHCPRPVRSRDSRLAAGIPIWLQTTLPGLYGRLERWLG